MEIAIVALVVTIFVLVAIVTYIVMRDIRRTMRVTNLEVRREDITPSLPDDWLRKFYER